MADNNTPLTLKIVTPDARFPEIHCDSILLSVKDNEKGKGGGIYGIKKGHAKSLMATADGTVTAKTGGETQFCEALKEGFASVENNVVTLITE